MKRLATITAASAATLAAVFLLPSSPPDTSDAVFSLQADAPARFQSSSNLFAWRDGSALVTNKGGQLFFRGVGVKVLTWEGSAKEFSVWQGTNSGSYVKCVNVGTNQIFSLDLFPGTNYFAVTATTENGDTSDFSNEVVATGKSFFITISRVQ